MTSFIWIIEVLTENLRHGKHVDAVLLEDTTHQVVAENVALVCGILQVVLSDVLPHLLDGLGARQLRSMVLDIHMQ